MERRGASASPSEMYPTSRLSKQGASQYELELAEGGDMRGKALFHRQCHLGLDTMSWVRLGPLFTGLDFSD
jgi:hypothetical protein